MLGFYPIATRPLAALPVVVSSGGITGSVSATLGASTSSATGAVGIVGTSAITLGKATSTASGTLAITSSSANSYFISYSNSKYKWNKY